MHVRTVEIHMLVAYHPAKIRNGDRNMNFVFLLAYLNYEEQI